MNNVSKSPLNWVGGKSRLTTTILPMLPPHQCYVEVFAGAAWMLFRKEQSKVEVINDINSDLVTLYRVIKNHLEEFVKQLKWLLVAREQFDHFMMQEPETLTDIQRAARFYYVMRAGYGARVPNPTFAVARTGPSNFNLLRIEEDLSAAHLRLARVYIENRPYATVIERLDERDTFFYLDPPYFGCEGYYGKGIFEQADFARLRDQLASLKGKFIVSLNDTPEVREIFGRFNLQEVTTRYSLGNGTGLANQKAKELLIYNYDLPKRAG